MKLTSHLLLFLLFITGCRYPTSDSYQLQYIHLKNQKNCFPLMKETDFFLIVLVDARHLDYTENGSLLRTIAKHPSDGSKNGDVGHAWIYLQGIIDGKCVCIEGGHSGEVGMIQPKYFEGVMNYIDYGYADPNRIQRENPRHEPNPIKYMQEHLKDGFFQKGHGHHVPTYAAKIDISAEQFDRILKFIQEYSYDDYALCENQCSTFVAKVAAITNFSIAHSITMTVAQTVVFQGEKFVLWRDPKYATLTFSTPDIIERSLIQAVAEGCAEYALPWYFDQVDSQ